LEKISTEGNNKNQDEHRFYKQHFLSHEHTQNTDYHNVAQKLRGGIFN